MSSLRLTRRAFLTSLLAGGLYSGYALSNQTTHALTLEHETFHAPKLPEAFDGYRILFLTDIHAGPFVSLDWIAQSLREAMQFKPHLLLLGGDLIDAPKSTTTDALARLQGQAYIEAPQQAYADYYYHHVFQIIQEHIPEDGALMVPGNHDHWFPATLWKRHARNHGIRVLINEESSVIKKGQQLTIFGSDDYTTGFPEQPPISTTTPQSARLLLSHNPDYLRLLIAKKDSLAGFVGGLFGHTHGGQIILPAVGAPTYNISMTEFARGKNMYHDVPLYTSRGLGVVELPIRINCPPEITLLELRRT